MNPQSTWQIVIADRGWVYVGRIARDGDQVVLSECHNITRWAQGGLGRLAKNGPSKDDILYEYGTVRVHVLGVLGAIECDDGVWNAWRDKAEGGKAKKR